MTVHYIALTYEPKIAAVRQGTVRQTIRRVSKRVYKVGDKVVLHGWQDKPYRSPWNWRTEAFTLKEVERITMDMDGILAAHTSWPWGGVYAGCLATLDGIEPPTGDGLKKVLSSKNKNFDGNYWVLRW